MTTLLYPSSDCFRDTFVHFGKFLWGYQIIDTLLNYFGFWLWIKKFSWRSGWERRQNLFRCRGQCYDLLIFIIFNNYTLKTWRSKISQWLSMNVNDCECPDGVPRVSRVWMSLKECMWVWSAMKRLNECELVWKSVHECEVLWMSVKDCERLRMTVNECEGLCKTENECE